VWAHVLAVATARASSSRESPAVVRWGLGSCVLGGGTAVLGQAGTSGNAVMRLMSK
jgi:hypothetical protein